MYCSHLCLSDSGMFIFSMICIGSTGNPDFCISIRAVSSSILLDILPDDSSAITLYSILRTSLIFATDCDSLSAITPVVGSIAYLRSEEHTSELQSHHDLVCRLL